MGRFSLVLGSLWICVVVLCVLVLQVTAHSREQMRQLARKSATLRAVANPAAGSFVKQEPLRIKPAARVSPSGVALQQAPASDRLPPLHLMLLGTSVGDIPENSIAFIEDDKEKQQRPYRVGDTVQGWTLTRIEREAAVFSFEGSQRRIELRGEAPSEAQATPPVAPQDSANPWHVVADRVFKSDSLTKERAAKIKSAIHPVSDTKRIVDRASVYGTLKDNPLQVMREAAVLPAFAAGRLVGLQLSSVPEDGILKQSGFQSGDVIRTVNKEPVSDPATLLGLAAQLQQANAVQVEIERDGKPLTLTYQLQ